MILFCSIEFCTCCFLLPNGPRIQKLFSKVLLDHSSLVQHLFGQKNPKGYPSYKKGFLAGAKLEALYGTFSVPESLSHSPEMLAEMLLAEMLKSPDYLDAPADSSLYHSHAVPCIRSVDTKVFAWRSNLPFNKQKLFHWLNYLRQ